MITDKAIVELPLNGRNFIQLAQISAGAAPIGIGTSPATSWTGRGDSTLSLAGGRETNNSFLVNGIETRNSRFGSAGIRPSADAIEEFRVQRSTFGAEFGRSSAIINTTIRSGTNDLHPGHVRVPPQSQPGRQRLLRESLRRTKPPLTQNNFGAAAGGPVILPGYDGRNATFWFFNYEGLRQRQANTATALYPSPAQMSGNLADDSAGTGIFPTSSALCQANPSSRKCLDVIDPNTGLPFAGNLIPSNRLDQIVQKQLPYQPKPNVGVPANSPNFPNYNTIGFPKRVNDWDQYNVRLDHHFTSSDMLYGTFSNSDETLLAPALRPLGGDIYPQTDRLYTVTYTKILGPTKINEFRFGHNRSLTYRTAQTSNTKDYAKEEFGLKNTSPNPFDFGVPVFSPSGFSGVGSLSEAICATDTNIQFTDNFGPSRPAARWAIPASSCGRLSTPATFRTTGARPPTSRSTSGCGTNTPPRRPRPAARRWCSRRISGRSCTPTKACGPPSWTQTGTTSRLALVSPTARGSPGTPCCAAGSAFTTRPTTSTKSSSR